MFLSLRMHARHWSNPLGRLFLSGPDQDHRPSPTRCGGRRRFSEGQAAAPVGGGGAWPGFEPTRSATHQRHRRRRCVEAPEGPEVRAGFEARR